MPPIEQALTQLSGRQRLISMPPVTSHVPVIRAPARCYSPAHLGRIWGLTVNTSSRATAFALLGLLVTASAAASNLRVTPAHPQPGEPFTLEADYTSICAGPINGVSWYLAPPNPAYNFVNLEITSSVQCFDSAPGTYTFHLVTTVDGIAEGSYPVYTAVGNMGVFDPPYVDFALQGTIVVGGSAPPPAPEPAPSLSSWAASALAAALALLACVRARQRA